MSRIRASLLLTSLLVLWLPVAHAQSQACPEAVRRALRPSGAVSLVAEACRRAPDAPHEWLVSAAYATGDGAQGERALTQVVAIVDDQGTVLAQHRSAQDEDVVFALEEDALRIDSARYHLAPGQRAFGVVVHSSARGPSCPDRHFDDELTLYVREGRALRPVFSTYLDVTSAVQGGLCWSVNNDNVNDNALITLAMGKRRSHGYADIVATATITRWSQRDDRERTRRVQQVFRYDGQRYRPGDSAADAALFWERDSGQP